MAAKGGGMDMTRRAFLTYPKCFVDDDPENTGERLKGNSISKGNALPNSVCTETANSEDLTLRSVGLRNARENIRRNTI
jgi:hypothetical protein